MDRAGKGGPVHDRHEKIDEDEADGRAVLLKSGEGLAPRRWR
jgi:hypothetical protein